MFMPIIAIIDSNAKSFLVKFPIISNDDSMESFYYIFSIISKLILLLKYKKLILWFFKYKKLVKEFNLRKLINNIYFIKNSNLKKIFKPLNLFNKFNSNLKLIDLFYKKKFNLNKFFNKKNIIFFDFKFMKKTLFFKNFYKLFIYKYNYSFYNKLNIYISKNIRRVLLAVKSRKNLKRYRYRYKHNKRNKNLITMKSKNVTKYFSLYLSSFIYSIKNLRIFYNSFLINKNNNFFNLGLLCKFNNRFNRFNRFNKFKFLYYPFFSFIKKRSTFFKTTLSKFLSRSNIIKNKLLFRKNRYIKIFIELYYNK